MPAPAAPQRAEDMKAMYWRLNQPVSGGLLEAYSPAEDDWVPARFVTLPADGRVRVKWVSGGDTADLPSHHARNVGDGADEDPPVKRFLHSARPDWSEGDLTAVVQKLRVVGITESRALYQAVLDEVNGYDDGVNGLLKAHRQKVLVPKSLQALRMYGERLFSRPQHRRQEPFAPQSQAFEPRGAAAQVDARQAARDRRDDGRHTRWPSDSRQPELDQFDNTFARALLEDEISNDAPLGDQLRTPSPRDGHRRAALRPEDDDYLDANLPKIGGWQDEDLARLASVSAPAANSGSWIGDSFLASRVCCSRGHSLSNEPTPYDVNCDECGVELDEGAGVWRCDACAFDLCGPCHVAKQRKLGGLPRAQREPPPPRPRAEARAPVPTPLEEDEPRVYCPKRHLLKHELPSHPVECNYCSKEMSQKVQVWDCAFCGYYLCEDCHAEKAMD